MGPTFYLRCLRLLPIGTWIWKWELFNSVFPMLSFRNFSLWTCRKQMIKHKSKRIHWFFWRDIGIWIFTCAIHNVSLWDVDIMFENEFCLEWSHYGVSLLSGRWFSLVLGALTSISLFLSQTTAYWTKSRVSACIWVVRKSFQLFLSWRITEQCLCGLGHIFDKHKLIFLYNIRNNCNGN